jgi:glycosyltransferase involved in cell wall biosynthesis
MPPAGDDAMHPPAGRHRPLMKTMEVGLTVGMPVCDAMPWLPEAIDSLLQQTTSAFQILAIVDGGSDGSGAYLRDLENKMARAGFPWPRLRVLEQAHAGITATLNRLLYEARTPWLVRMDADDVSYPTRMEKLGEAIAEHPEAGLIYSLADYHPRERCAGQFRCSRGTPEELRAMVRSGYLLSICHSSVALNVEKVRAAGGYRMNIHAEDADLWWRMALQFEIHCVPEALVGFRLNPESVSSRNLENQQLAAIYVQYLLLSELWGKQPRPFGEIARPLGEFLQPAAVEAKEALREFNMLLAEKRYMRGLGALARAFHVSPGYVSRRVRDELRKAAIGNGVAPDKFWKRKEALWA